ncbi:hypothetical protein H8E77_41290 [bacterium]|nr:hypothetical protein [bacterium]
MSLDVVIYIELHHPLRLRLPAQLVPDGATLEDFRRCLFDEKIDRKPKASVSETNRLTLHSHQAVHEAEGCEERSNLARSQFYPHLFKTFSDLMERGYKLSIGVSGGFLRYILQLASAPVPSVHPDYIEVHQQLPLMLPRWDEFVSKLQLEQMPWGFGGLITHPQVEIICIEPYSSLSFYLDIDMFIQQTAFFKRWWEERLGKKLSAAATTELCMSNEIYKSFANLQFNAVVMEGAEWVLQGREPSYLCKINGHPLLCLRHKPLSTSTMEILSDPLQENITPRMKAVAQQIKEAPGDFVLLGWDINSLRGYDNQSEVVESSLSQLCEKLDSLGVTFLTVSEVATKFSSNARRLTLPAFTSTRVDGGMGYLLNSNTQQWIFELIHHAYNMAKLSKNEDLIDIALWLAQIDNLKLADSFSSGLKPDWYSPTWAQHLNPDELLQELGRVYANFIKAARYYI